MTNHGLHSRILGNEILTGSAQYIDIHVVKKANERLIADMNTGYRSEEEVISFMEQITGRNIDSSVTISLPFYTDFGKHIQFGKDIFINQNVMFVDLGGITIEDQVLIGPGAHLLTVNHLVDPKKRRGLVVKPIHVKRNAWIGAAATILPGITIGENSVVSAGSVVTKDIPDNVIVAGTPAKVLRIIEQST
ncbi:MAG: sugar O-acetyltransferase [Alkalibacterium sp.]|nr:sugar O-acetyltransferase [Alkalibacterium sp.]